MELHPQLKYYLGLGWALIPLSSGKKKGAAVKWKNITEPPSEEQVLNWRISFGTCNWAVLLGPSNLICLDLDDTEAFKIYIRDFDLEFPKTAMVKSPGGAHLYFQAGPLDLDRTLPRPFGFAGEYRAGRAIVVLPYLKNHYTWLATPDNIQPVPGWIRGLIHARATPPPQHAKPKEILPGNVNRWMETAFNADPPERHVYLVGINRAMIDDGIDLFDRERVLLGVNRNFKKGAKSDEEVRRIAIWTPG